MLLQLLMLLPLVLVPLVLLPLVVLLLSQRCWRPSGRGRAAAAFAAPASYARRDAARPPPAPPPPRPSPTPPRADRLRRALRSPCQHHHHHHHQQHRMAMAAALKAYHVISLPSGRRGTEPPKPSLPLPLCPSAASVLHPTTHSALLDRNGSPAVTALSPQPLACCCW